MKHTTEQSFYNQPRKAESQATICHARRFHSICAVIRADQLLIAITVKPAWETTMKQVNQKESSRSNTRNRSKINGAGIRLAIFSSILALLLHRLGPALTIPVRP
jgi:hypothetical protein